MTTRITSDNITDATITTTDIATSVPLAVDWQAVKTASFTAVAGEGYFVNTAGGVITVTLPASPSIGDTVAIVDFGSASTNNITINRNGSNIEGSATNDLFTSNNQSEILVYSDGTRGWVKQTSTSDLPTFIQATGGTESTSGNYKIHTFNSSSNFVVSDLGNQPVKKVDYLVVAGGGGGGFGRAGGGGAGGARESKDSNINSPHTASPIAATTGITVTAQTYPITVGGGGAGRETTTGFGTKGSNSVFATITSAGGGGGVGENNPMGPGANGGSGGGGVRDGSCGTAGGTGNTPPVSPAQGTNGGASFPSGGAGGGGGGASAAGSASTPSGTGGSGGTGGVGITTHISGSPTVYAGGGGGGNADGAPNGNLPNPGPGGGGSGGSGVSPGTPGNPVFQATAGSANTGGGGGGGAHRYTPNTNYRGGDGGSGIVIIRYKYQ